MSEQRKRERRVTLMLLVVIITFFIVYAPLPIAATIQAIKYKVEAWVENLTVITAMLNHVNNPLIYGMMNGNFRQAVLNCFVGRKLEGHSEQLPSRSFNQSYNFDRGQY